MIFTPIVHGENKELSDLCKDRKYVELEKICRAMLKSDPNNAEVYHYLGASLYSQHKDKEAFQYVEKAYKLAPENGLYHINLARVYYRIGDYKKCIAICKEDIKKFGDHPYPRYLIAASKFRSNLITLDEVIKELESIVKALPEHHVYVCLYTDLADFYLMKKSYTSAIYYLSKALKYESKNEYLYVCRGNAYMVLQDYAKAIDNFTTVTLLNSNHKTIDADFSYAFQMSGKYEEALKYMDKAIIKNPDDKYLLVRKSGILRLMGKYKEAIQLLEEVEKIDLIKNKDIAATIYFELGENYFDINEFKKAKTYFKKSLKNNRNNSFITQRINYIDKKNQ